MKKLPESEKRLMHTGQFKKDGVTFYTAETEEIAICVCPEKGGELSSVVYKKLLPGRELLRRGNDYSPTDDPFKGRAPLMWPAVTRNYIPEDVPRLTTNDQPSCSYRYKEKVYEIGPSAFAKDVPWAFDGFNDDGCLVSRLESSPQTRAMYPFDFSATSSFRIDGEQVVMEYTIENTGDEKMFFSIGNHIGLNLPFGSDSALDDVLLHSSGSQRRGITKERTYANSYTPLPLESGMRLDDPRNVFNMVTHGYRYEDNFFRMSDRSVCFEIRHQVLKEACRGEELPDESNLYYTLYGSREAGFLCTEPWIGGINSLNTGDGLIYLAPGGRFRWEIMIRWGEQNREST